MVSVGCARVSDRAQHFGGLAIAAHGMATIQVTAAWIVGAPVQNYGSSESTCSAVGNQIPGSPVVGPRAIILHVFQSASANTSFTSSN